MGVVLSAAAAVSCGRVVLAACTAAAAAAVADVMDVCSLWFMVSLLVGRVSAVGVVLSVAAAVSCGRVVLAACTAAAAAVAEVMDVCSLRFWFLFWLDESVMWVWCCQQLQQ